MSRQLVLQQVQCVTPPFVVRTEVSTMAARRTLSGTPRAFYRLLFVACHVSASLRHSTTA